MECDCNVTTYRHPPEGNYSISELERLGNERIGLYKIFNHAYDLKLKLHSKDWEKFVSSQIYEQNLNTYKILLTNESFEKTKAHSENNIAHWLLSLSYCQSDESRRYFVKWELIWFILQYKKAKEEDIREFLLKNRFVYTPLSEQEKDCFKEQLLSCGNNINLDAPYYKTNFKDISYLVASRKVFIYKGMAYFPESDIIFCVKQKLCSQFYRQLVWNTRIEFQDERVKNLISKFSFIPKKWTSSEIEIPITLDNIDEISRQHYPPCMQVIHNVLRSEHHLKYGCKMQYGIFLKCLGLSYDDAMVFWRDEFVQKMTDDLYTRKYSYLFKHQYGMVGGRIQYQPYTCDYILKYTPGPTQHHGCPFKHWDKDKLKRKLHDDGLTSGQIRDIEDLVNEDNHQQACTNYFCAQRSIICADIITSPNQFALESFKIEKQLDLVFKSICNKV